MKKLLNMAVSEVHFKCNENMLRSERCFGNRIISGRYFSKCLAEANKTALSRDISERFLECNKKIMCRAKGVE